MPVSTSISPPHDLSLVVEFVNTRDIEEGTDQLTGPADLGGWLRERGLLASGTAAPTDAEHRRALALREALRSVLLTHNGGEPAPSAARELERVAERGALSVHFTADGRVTLAPRGIGIDAALAGLLVPVAHAAADGSWERMKVCGAGDCRWAFYDFSRNRSGRWCDMAVCGNRTKVRAYRSRR